jgi:predicted ribosome quality control (RQC) complex YloA/Tae2 family protein
LVVGGKSALQNDELINRIKKEKEDFLVMHTSSPGSPFSVIISNIKSIDNSDKEEAAIFTGCFSQAWKSKEKKVKIHLFNSSDLEKSRYMKSGTWTVKKIIQEILYLIIA